MTHLNWQLTMLDGGGRYGIHSTMRDIACEHHIYAFEPDLEEYEYLKEKYKDSPSYTVEKLALSDKIGEAEFHLYNHKGCSSVIKPNPDSIWFKSIRPNEAGLIGKSTIQTTTIDHYCNEKNIQPDLIKLDIEGSELLALKGATKALKNCLALHIELVFDKTHAKAAAPDVLDFLINQHNFTLANLSYNGKGASVTNMHAGDYYGLLLGTEAFFIRSTKPEDLKLDELVKLSIFCLQNNLTDYAFLCLKTLTANIKDNKLTPNKTTLFLEQLILRNSYGFKMSNQAAYLQAKEIYYSLFHKEFPENHLFFRAVDRIQTELES